MADDKTLSEKIIYSADALKYWEEMEPLATEVTNLVNEYREFIDGISTVFGVVGAIWDIYSSMEKAKQDAAQQQAMVNQIIHAVDMMITSAKTEITHHMDKIETRATVVAAKTVLEGFAHDFMPYVNTNALTEKNIEKLDSLRSEARGAIVKLHELIPVRAKSGDGAAILILYRNLLAVVQCKLTMDRLQYGLTHAVVMEAKSEINRLLFVIGVVNEGLWLASDHCFSPGIVFFHVGGHGRPELTNYSYLYKGKRQPVSGSNKALVSKAFIEARKAARDHAIPQEVFDWENLSIAMMVKFQELEKTVPV